MTVLVTATRYHDQFHYLSTDEMIGASLALYGEYAQTEIDLLLAVMPPAAVFYDVGANIGVHARAMAQEGHQVWAWEPNPINHDLLCRNMADLSGHTIRQAAVGHTDGQTTIGQFDPDRPGNHGHVLAGQGGLPVDLVRLDAVSAPDPAAIKIDVEGQELAVLLGSIQRIRRSRPIILYEAQETPDLGQIYHLLRGLDYQLWWVLVMNYRPNNWRGNSHNVFENSAVFSVLALPSDRAAPVLDPVLSAADTWQAYCERFNQGRS